MTKSKLTLAAALVFGTAAAALAQSGEEIQNSQYQLNPNAPVPVYALAAAQPSGLIEGRNVAVRVAQERVANDAGAPIEGFGGY